MPIPTPTPSAGGSVDTVAASVYHSDLIYDSSRDLLYAYVPPDAADHATSIAVVSPETGAVAYSVPLNVKPWFMVASRDGKYLYTADEDTGAVVRFSLPSFVEDGPRIDPGMDLYDPDYYGKLFAKSVAVSPSDSDTIAVALWTMKSIPQYRGLVVYQAGTEISREAPSNPDIGYFPTNRDLVVFGDSDSEVYTSTFFTSPDSMTRMAISGPQVTETANTTLYNADDTIQGPRSLSYVAGKLLTPGGSVVDAVTFQEQTQFYGDPACNYIGCHGGCVFADDTAAIGACLDLTVGPGTANLNPIVGFYTLNDYVPFAGISIPGGFSDFSKLVHAGGQRLALSRTPRLVDSTATGNLEVDIFQEIPQPPAH